MNAAAADRLFVRPFVCAAVQMNSRLDKAANVATATRLVEQAHAAGAELVVLPEMFNCLGPLPEVVAVAEPIPGPTSEAMSRLAARLQITLLAGSICERSDAPDKGYNTSLLFLPDGQLTARYRKLHLFDVAIPDRVEIEESSFILPGDEIVCRATPLARLGMSTCYDVRFPELYRRLAAAASDVLCVPAAFTRTTGRDHWELLLRARAVENQAFLIGANQCGRHGRKLESYGHSLIIDPWGQVLAAAHDEEAVISAELDPARLADVRQQLPSLEHRRDIGRVAERSQGWGGHGLK
ncbi:MAG: carbon-nitrogen hydrolase family protein [Planctomycetota bacterium]|nr:MAG: carbon-nitrogen hydrolase family protein [Planctomycetota bacterium]